MTQGIRPWTPSASWAPSSSPSTPAAATGLAHDAATPRWANLASGPPALGGGLSSEGAGRVEDARHDERAALVQQRLDAFRSSMTATYHGCDRGDDVYWDAGGMRVAAPFAMSKHYATQESSMKKLERVVAKAAVSAHLSLATVVNRIQKGRGSPHEIRVLTQALIDTVGEPAGGRPWGPQAVRQLMFDCGIGIDCAGYTQQAYLAATGLTRPQAGFRDVMNEALFGLDQRGFRRVASLQDVRPGDIVSMTSGSAGEVGHRAIVYEQRRATASDMASLLALGCGAQAFAVGGPIRVLELDSSWGCAGHASLGGVKRQTFWYNESAAQWAWLEERAPSNEPVNAQKLDVSPRLYDHLLDGFYRGPER